MNRMISLILLIVGIVLVVYGVGASNSLSSELSTFFNGVPSDKAMWMLIGGAILGVIGLAGMLRRPRQG